MKAKTVALILAAATAVVGTKAETLDETDVRAAAVAFVNRDEIGASVLAGRQVASVTARDALWIVRLSPSGYIVFSGDTAAEPVIAFSENDYVEPPDNSPFGALLTVANGNAQMSSLSARTTAGTASLLASAPLASALTSGASDVADRRAAKWTELLGGNAAKTSTASAQLLAASPASSSAADVAPFLKTTWNQGQPYNDYAPVYSAEGDGYSSRGRCPCGCVATAYAQVLKYWEWPKRFENSVSFTHDAYDSAGVLYPFSLRFDGCVPFDWQGMRESYPWPSGATDYDWRGALAESNRYAIARLILCADVLAKMSFVSDGSSASVPTLVGANPWYESGEYLQRNGSNYVGTYVSDESTLQSRICADVRNGVPVLVSITTSGGGHTVVAHGWKSGSDGTNYMYFNYGWGGSNDGYFTMSASEDGSETAYVKGALVGHVPTCVAQIEPLPAVSDPDSAIDLKWSVPERRASEITGFTLNWKELGTETTPILQDFSEASWISTDSTDLIRVATSSSLDNDTKFLQITQRASGVVDLFDDEVMLTSCSELSYRVRIAKAIGLTVRLQVNADGGTWETVDTLPIWTSSSESDWMERKIHLGAWGGQIVKLRLAVETNGSYFYSCKETWGVQIDDVQISNVLSFENRVEEALDESTGSPRSFSVSEAVAGKAFSPGALYAFEIMPTGVAESAKSGAVHTRISGTANVPQPGEASFVTNDVAYSAGAENWMVQTTSQNVPSGSKAVLGPEAGALSLYVEGAVTEKSVFSFSWTSKNYFTSSYDEISVRWIDADDGSITTLFATTNKANKTKAQAVSVSLADLAGRQGEIGVAVEHRGSSYDGVGYGLCVQNAKVTNVANLVKPAEIAWAMKTFTASSLPSITGVTSYSSAAPLVQEGFYRECARGTNVFFVSCSANVTSLAARPSHLSLVPDSAVAVFPQGNGKFIVTVDGSGIGDEHDRSRLILTLVASDANGTTAAKDLSLRFSSETRAETFEPPAEEKVTSTTPIPVPHAWLVEKGLVAEGASDADFETAAKDDPDGDGQPTYAEYLCGTDPQNKDDVFRAFIEMEDGDPVISWAPTNAAARYVVQGVTNLADRTWVDTNAVNRAGLRFFRVRVEMP